MSNLEDKKKKLDETLLKLEALVISRQNTGSEDLQKANAELEQANDTAQKEILAKNTIINELKEKNAKAKEEVSKLIEQLENTEA